MKHLVTFSDHKSLMAQLAYCASAGGMTVDFANRVVRSRGDEFIYAVLASDEDRVRMSGIEVHKAHTHVGCEPGLAAWARSRERLK